MLDAIKLWVDKNIFIDICHWNIPPLNYSETKKKVEVIKTVVGNKISFATTYAACTGT